MLALLVRIIWQCFLLPVKLLMVIVKTPYLFGMLIHKVIRVAKKLHEGFLKSKKLGNKILSLLNFGASGYSIYVTIEPFFESLLEKRKK